MERFKVYLESTFNLTGQNKPTEEDWKIISSNIVRKDVPKKYLLIKESQIENHLYFIEKGIARFFIPKEDNDITFNIVFENGFLSAYDSFLSQTPSTYCIETLTDSVLWQFNYNDLQSVYSKTKIGNLIGRKACEELFSKKQKRELELLNCTAEERYLKLFTEQPRLLKEIPLKYISSYIGITPQALSRIRKRIS